MLENLVTEFWSAGSDASELAPRTVSATKSGIRLERDFVDCTEVSQVKLVEIRVALVLKNAREVLLRYAQNFLDLKK